MKNISAICKRTDALFDIKSNGQNFIRNLWKYLNRLFIAHFYYTVVLKILNP